MRCWRNSIQAVAVVTLAGGLFSGLCAADLPQTVRESSSSEQYKAQINKYISDEIALVMAGDKDLSAAREGLCRQAETTPSVTPSSSFQTMYVGSFLENATPLLTSKEVVQRLNGAIIVYHICGATHSPQLTPTVQRLMKDPSPAVALWGIKSASVLLPTVLGVQYNLKSQKLTSDIIACAQAHENVGSIVQEAYGAVSVGDLQPPLPAAALQACIDAMNQLLALRTAQWQKARPDAPQADRTPPIFFVRSTINQAMTPAEKFESVQQLMNMMGVTAQRAEVMTASDERTQIYFVSSAFAQALRVVFINDNQPVPAAKFSVLGRLPGTMQPAQIKKAISDAFDAVKAVPAYSALKPIPEIQAKAG